MSDSAPRAIPVNTTSILLLSISVPRFDLMVIIKLWQLKKTIRTETKY